MPKVLVLYLWARGALNGKVGAAFTSTDPSRAIH
jgi:hypothetical protein